MKNSIGINASSRISRWLRMLAAMWHWLIEPSASVVKPENRFQARLLMAMLLVLMTFGLFSLALSLLGVYSKLEEPREVAFYRWITLAAVLLLAVVYGLSRSPYYSWAAALTVGTVLVSIFVVMTITPADVQYAFFLILGGLVASLFLSARTTAIVFMVTFVGLLLLPTFAPGFSNSNNIYALFFILTVGGLVVMAANLRQHYLEQIDKQTQQLVESEARLRELSVRDSLTGLFNRRYLEEMLELELIRAARKSYMIGVIMADIDHFKRFNDIHGHAAGDAVLVQVSNFLRTHVRSSDITCRFGGEEFILILPDASKEITQMRARRIWEDVRRLRIQYDGQSLEAVTLSLGVAVFPDHGSTHDAILRAADIAMYRAKRDGRDRVVTAD